MKMTPAEWIRTVTPLVAICMTAFIWFMRLEGRVNTTEVRLESEIARSLNADTQQGSSQRDIEIAMAELKRDITYIKESVDKNSSILPEILRELRK
ncbi:MAG: hypothetical protein KKD44_28570 [Proteobacteria bacterium]|nr:hypothetical protein [Pseudomonadota bacterium]